MAMRESSYQGRARVGESRREDTWSWRRGSTGEEEGEEDRSWRRAWQLWVSRRLLMGAVEGYIGIIIVVGVWGRGWAPGGANCKEQGKANTILYYQLSMSQQQQQPGSSAKQSSYSVQIQKESPPQQPLDADIMVSMPKSVVSKTVGGGHSHHVSDGSMQVVEEVMNENRSIRAINKQLRRKLEQFEKRLDDNLSRKRVEVKTKVSQEMVESMELKNAYKMIEIYKKEIAHLKRKEAAQYDGRAEDLASLVMQLQKQKQHMSAEIKDLIRINKQHEKGMKEISGPHVHKLVQENQELKQQIRRMQYESNHEQDSQMKKSHYHRRNDRMHEPQQPQERYKSVRQPSDEEKIDKLRHKILKDSKKIAVLMSQNSRLKQHVEELRGQLVQKTQQFLQLRQRFINLSKRISISKQKKQDTEPQTHNRIRIRTQQNEKQKASRKRQKSEYQSNQLTLRPKKQPSKYPNEMQAGSHNQLAYRWNHSQYSSKVKQIQVCPHPSGHIMEVNFRYQRGQPLKLSTRAYASFCCDENSSEYIRTVRGGFNKGLLCYLVVQTSKGRKSNFCQYDLEEECDNFYFNPPDGYHLASFFGENTENGVCLLGCAIGQDK